MNDCRMNDMFKQMEELFEKVDNLTIEIDTLKKKHKKEINKLKKEQQKEIKVLKDELKEKDIKIEKLENKNKKLETEVIRLKNQNKKDSSNSNKPSGTNGLKKVITNRREKSDKKQGGQQGHKENSLGKKDLEKINFFKSFMGIIIKDGTDLYNGFGIGYSQCISHIQRYLKGVYDFVNHKGPRKMAEYLTKYNNYRNELIQKGKTKFSQTEYERIRKEYEDIIKEWKREWMSDVNNSEYDNERKLLSRMEEDDKEQILYNAFIKIFKGETVIA